MMKTPPPEAEPVLTLCTYCQDIVVDAPPKADGSISYGYCQTCWERDKPHIEKLIRQRKGAKSKRAQT